MKCFIKRLRWCWRILRGGQFALFFIKADNLSACKYGTFCEEDWQTISDFTQQTAIYSRANALQQFAADIEAAEDEAQQAALVTEARQLIQPR